MYIIALAKKVIDDALSFVMYYYLLTDQTSWNVVIASGQRSIPCNTY